jgi:uncharacterized protein YciI
MKHFILTCSYQDAPHRLSAELLEKHRTFIHRAHLLGLFLLWGPRMAQGGWVAVARFESAEALDEFLKRDPVRMAGMGTFEVVEFQRQEIPVLPSGDTLDLERGEPGPRMWDQGVFI